MRSKLDITEAVIFAREGEVMLYPILLYLLKRAVVEQGGVAHICYEIYQAEDEKIWWQWSDGTKDFAAFYQEYVSDYLHYEGRLKPGMSQDALFVVCDRGGEELVSDCQAVFLQNMREENGRCLLDLRLENVADETLIAANLQKICTECRKYLV